MIGASVPIASYVVSLPEGKSGVESAAAAINAKGGINGHQIKVDFCDGKFAVNSEIACARQFVNAKVSAVIAPLFVADQAGTSLKTLAAAKIPVIGTQGLSPTDFNTASVYPLASGIPGWTYGAIADLIQHGSKRIAVIGDSAGVSSFQVDIAGKGLKSAGITPLIALETDVTNDPTFAISAAKVAGTHPDGVFAVESETTFPKEIQALRQAGYSGPIATISSEFNAAILKTLGSLANGIRVSSQLALATDKTNPDVVAYLADMHKYAPTAELDEVSENGWAAVQLFDKVATQQKAFSGATFTAAMNDIATPIDINIIGPYQVKGRKPSLAGFPRMFNPTVYFGVVKNGQIEPDGHAPVNPFAALAK